MTATQARRAMGARAELENQLLLLELAGRAPARRSCSSEKMCYHRSLNWQSERRSRLVALSPHTRGPAWTTAREKYSRRRAAMSVSMRCHLTSTHFHLLRVAGGPDGKERGS